MVLAVWSVKGGAGTTSVAAMLALGAVARAESVVLVDLCGDVAAVLGAEPVDESPGLTDWSALTTADPVALRRLEVAASSGLSYLPRGTGDLVGEPRSLLAALAESGRRVIIDCGNLGPPHGESDYRRGVVQAASANRVVLRRCFLTLRSMQEISLLAGGVVLLDEPGRFYTRTDVEAAAGAPVVATVAIDARVANRIDAGLLRSPLPRTLLRAMSRTVADAA